MGTTMRFLIGVILAALGAVALAQVTVVQPYVRIDPGVDAGTHSHAVRSVNWIQQPPSRYHDGGYSAHIDQRCKVCGAVKHTQWGRDTAGKVLKPDGGAP